MKWLTLFSNKRCCRSGNTGGADDQQERSSVESDLSSQHDSMHGEEACSARAVEHSCAGAGWVPRKARWNPLGPGARDAGGTTDQLHVFQAGGTTLINSYALLKHLGSGASGHVSLALDLRDQRMYAIKECSRGRQHVPNAGRFGSCRLRRSLPARINGGAGTAAAAAADASGGHPPAPCHRPLPHHASSTTQLTPNGAPGGGNGAGAGFPTRPGPPPPPPFAAADRASGSAKRPLSPQWGQQQQHHALMGAYASGPLLLPEDAYGVGGGSVDSGRSFAGAPGLGRPSAAVGGAAKELEDLLLSDNLPCSSSEPWLALHATGTNPPPSPERRMAAADGGAQAPPPPPATAATAAFSAGVGAAPASPTRRQQHHALGRRAPVVPPMYTAASASEHPEHPPPAFLDARLQLSVAPAPPEAPGSVLPGSTPLPCSMSVPYPTRSDPGPHSAPFDSPASASPSRPLNDSQRPHWRGRNSQPDALPPLPPAADGAPTSKADESACEVSVLKLLDHPNIVKLVEVIDDPRCDTLLLVMEYVQGESLQPPVVSPHAWERLPEDLLWHRARDVILALQYMHARGIVHGDVKPANIVVDRTSRVAKLVDFGSAAVVVHPPTPTTPPTTTVPGSTAVAAGTGGAAGAEVAAGGGGGGAGQEMARAMRRSRSLACTPAFRSPESLLPGYQLSPELDMWALGVTLYLLVFGELPFAGATPFHIYEAVRSSELAPPTHTRTSSQLSDLLRGLLEKDVRRRLTVDQVMAHPWTTGSSAAPLTQHRPSATAAVTADPQQAQQAWRFGGAPPSPAGEAVPQTSPGSWGEEEDEGAMVRDLEEPEASRGCAEQPLQPQQHGQQQTQQGQEPSPLPSDMEVDSGTVVDGTGSAGGAGGVPQGSTQGRGTGVAVAEVAAWGSRSMGGRGSTQYRGGGSMQYGGGIQEAGSTQYAPCFSQLELEAVVAHSVQSAHGDEAAAADLR